MGPSPLAVEAWPRLVVGQPGGPSPVLHDLDQKAAGQAGLPACVVHGSQGVSASGELNAECCRETSRSTGAPGDQAVRVSHRYLYA